MEEKREQGPRNRRMDRIVLIALVATGVAWWWALDLMMK